ncbi:alpha/beta hydrolase [Salinibacterium sp. ZJ70]|uniref:alpha/beta hydrolase n=1 Tax=Salinibacterium sp. ZJ70 TaxID=2708084 RepID=UPI00142137CC|nr:alpha/beta hydrolase [Salinibacterium sp. ZJ70]
MTPQPIGSAEEDVAIFFACFAAEHGVATVTYNYRGVGATARAHPHLRMRDWLLEDAPAATAFATQRFASIPQVAVGHSLGGHALLLGAGGEHVTRFASVASHLAATTAIPSRSELVRVAAILGVIDDPSFDARDRAEATTVPILAVGVDDDPWSAPAAIDALVAAAGGPVERRQYSPADLDQERVGHHGLFRRGAGARFWPELVEWLTRTS